MKALSFGGDKRDRTADLLHAMQALSQLSYTPKRSTALVEENFKAVTQRRRNIKDGLVNCQRIFTHEINNRMYLTASITLRFELQ